MNSKQIRETFLNFFESKQHTVVDSAPIVLKDDPTLMFTNAGMNQFKDFFLGTKVSPYKRVANTQKCLRVAGKHNDLEEVGIDTYHHTSFEMLGNWSFADYFKKEAIEWAWELLIDFYKLPKERLYATIFEGEKKDNLTRDTEAENIWSHFLPKERILACGKKDNFWEMGASGPCGPSSELHIDLRPQNEIDLLDGAQLVNQDHPKVVEIWNLVFIQHNRLVNGALEKLPKKYIDTGMGFERIVMAVQNQASTYDTDVFESLISWVTKKAKVTYGKDNIQDIAIRVIVDHIRTIAFTIADGQLPSNNKAGYVIRRILRRAVRYGYSYLNFFTPFLHEMIPLVAKNYKDIFPEVYQQQDFIVEVVKEEEISFLHTMEKGLKKLDKLIESRVKYIDGKTAFELYDTYGFPIDLTELIAKENILEVKKDDFLKLMKQQKDRSRKASNVQTDDWVILQEGDSIFVGYDFQQCESEILRYRKVDDNNKIVYQIILGETPFYAESGGQIGDIGTLEGNGGKIKIGNTIKENDLWIHISSESPHAMKGKVVARIDSKRRKLITNHHSATHLLHASLKQVLGRHVEQKGSLVSDNKLRFDFSHIAPITQDKLAKIESIVNEQIRKNIALEENRHVALQEAKKQGATALFGEKYGEFVRVISFDPSFSIELCGGTHVPYTGSIGLFSITKESSIASGVRRIEAVTGACAEKFHYEKSNELLTISNLLNNPPNIISNIDTLIKTNQSLEKQLKVLKTKELSSIKQSVLSKSEVRDGIHIIAYTGTFDSSETVKQLSFEIKQQLDSFALLIGANIDKKPFLSVMLSEDIVKSGYNASILIKKMAKVVEGGGGGQAFYATAGGKNVEKIKEAVDLGKQLIIDEITK